MTPKLTHRFRGKKGSILVEFAAIALVMYLLLAGILTFGRLLFTAQTMTSAVDTAARELSVTPLPAAATFEEVRDEVAPPTAFRQDTYSEDYLVIDITSYLNSPGGMSLISYLDSIDIPRVNRMLVPVMQIQEISGDYFLRYPGALVQSPTAPSGMTVVVPRVINIQNDGTTEIEFVRVLEEVDTEDEPGDNTGTSPDPFMVTEESLAALRLNYPFQSVSIVASTNNQYILADDSLVSAVNSPGGALIDPGDDSGPNAGLYGLGSQYSFVEEVRPFRRVISTQAAFKREIFE